MSEKFLGVKQAVLKIKESKLEYVKINNPDYLFPDYEIMPLAPKISANQPKLIAAVMDMDGTTTTTETLCIHSLEFMVRKITKKMDENSWTGLDQVNDYPNIIGNSTTKHVEYLIKKYRKNIQQQALINSYLYAVVWFLKYSKDQNRLNEVRNNITNLGGSVILEDKKLKESLCTNSKNELQIKNIVKYLLKKYPRKLKISSISDYTRVGIDIYYQRYHEILSNLESESQNFNLSQLNIDSENLIKPMPGVAEFLVLIKGLIGKEIVNLIPGLINDYQLNHTTDVSKEAVKQITKNLRKWAIHYEKQPMKIAIVTSSIKYEAQIVLSQIFRNLKKQIKAWKISKDRKHRVLKKMENFNNFYDAIVTATDSSEIRLKPHRDLYSIALHQLGITKSQFNQVIGFEDSESGTIAIRTAGIGLCIAVPFAETSYHDFSAASHICKGGLLEVMLKHNLFLK